MSDQHLEKANSLLMLSGQFLEESLGQIKPEVVAKLEKLCEEKAGRFYIGIDLNTDGEMLIDLKFAPFDKKIQPVELGKIVFPTDKLLKHAYNVH